MAQRQLGSVERERERVISAGVPTAAGVRSAARAAGKGPATVRVLSVVLALVQRGGTSRRAEAEVSVVVLVRVAGEAGA